MHTETATGLRVTSGHLTAREKSAIVHMLNNDMMHAKTARITFALEADASQPEGSRAYRVTSSRSEVDGWGRKVTRTDRAAFEVLS